MSSKHSDSILRLRRSLARLEKALHARGRTIEGTALSVVKDASIAEAEEPHEYSHLRHKQKRALARAQRIEQLRFSRTLRKAKRSSPGTSTRLDGLKSYIYETEHYLLPILERIAPDEYKSTLKTVLAEAVSEYASWTNDFEDYVARSILGLLSRAEKLGIAAPIKVRAACEKALVLTTNKFFDAFEALSSGFWDKELKEKAIGTETFRDRRLADPSVYGPLLREISIIPEHRIGQLIRAKDPLANVEQSGGKLLELAIQRGLLGTREHPAPAYSVAKGYLAAVRNKPHHGFPTYDFQEVVDSILFTNQVLRMIDRRESSDQV